MCKMEKQSKGLQTVGLDTSWWLAVYFVPENGGQGIRDKSIVMNVSGN